jgi:NADH-quinone oxidoreductase subunit L
MDWIVSHLWLIPVIPLSAALLTLALSGSSRTVSASLAVLGQAAAFTLSVLALLPTLRTTHYAAFSNFTWFTFGEQAVRLGWLLDPLTAAMIVMITLVSLCIFIFSIGYMAEDKHFTRFFAYLSFFSAAMLGLVIANSLLLVFICWELVGPCAVDVNSARFPARLRRKNHRPPERARLPPLSPP